MNCRDCNMPMRQWAADNYFCEACRLECIMELVGPRWKRHHPPAPVAGDVLTDRAGRKWRLEWVEVG